LQFRYRGSRRESAVAQLFSLGILRFYDTKSLHIISVREAAVIGSRSWRFSEDRADMRHHYDDRPSGRACQLHFGCRKSEQRQGIDLRHRKTER
jgi:hypothetical protein